MSDEIKVPTVEVEFTPVEYKALQELCHREMRLMGDEIRYLIVRELRDKELLPPAHITFGGFWGQPK